MRIFLLITIVFTVSFGYSQVQWERSYGGWGADEGYAVKQTLDTGYIVVGKTSSFHHQTQFYILKIDKNGNIVWTNHIGGEGVEAAYDVAYASDSGFAVVGITNSFSAGYDILFTKLNKLGDTLLTKTYGGEDWDFAYAMALLPDSGYIIAGETYSYGDGNNDAYLIRTNKSGDTLWTKTFGGTEDDYFKDVIVTQNGEIVAVGTTNSLGAGNEDVYVVRLTTSGTVVYENAIGTSNQEEGKKVIELNNGDLAIVGRNHDGNDWNGWMFTTNASGTILGSRLWNNWAVGPNQNQDAAGIAKFKNRDSVVVAINVFQDGFFANNLVGEKIELASGLPNVSGTGFIKYISADDTWATDVDTCFDGGFIYLAYNTGIINNNNSDKSIYLIKTNKKNKTTCGDIPASNCIQYKYDFSSGIVGLEDKNIETDKLVVYPNPSNGNIQINLPNNTSKLKIYNALGILVKEISTQNLSNLTLNMQGELSSGTYFLKTFRGNNEALEQVKLIITN